MNWCLNVRESFTLPSRTERPLLGKSLLLPRLQRQVSTDQGFPTFGRDLTVHFEIFSGEFQQVASTAAFLLLLDFPQEGKHAWLPKPISRTFKGLPCSSHSHTVRDFTGHRAQQMKMQLSGGNTNKNELEQWVLCQSDFSSKLLVPNCLH